MFLQWQKDREPHDWLSLRNAPEVTRMLREDADDRCAGGPGVKHLPLRQFAISHGSSEMLELMSQRGYRFDEAALGGQPPLHLAIVAGNLDGVKFALQQGSSPNEPAAIPANNLHPEQRSRQYTPLMAAASQSNAARDMTSIITSLIAAGASLETPDDAGRTPLMAAVETGDLRSVRALHQAGARLTAKDSKGQGVLHLVPGRSGSYLVLQYLLAKGADVNLRDKEGRTPLHRAVTEFSTPEIALMVKHGADPKIVDAAGKRPIDLVATVQPAVLRKGLLLALSGKWPPPVAAGPPLGTPPPNSLSNRAETLLN